MTELAKVLKQQTEQAKYHQLKIDQIYNDMERTFRPIINHWQAMGAFTPINAFAPRIDISNPIVPHPINGEESLRIEWEEASSSYDDGVYFEYFIPLRLLNASNIDIANWIRYVNNVEDLQNEQARTKQNQDRIARLKEEIALLEAQL